jgi:putative AbiEii toxin of type IV toxin-antitoxin system/AAA ATPase-like protein
MALNSVCVGNFKGIYAPQTIELKPITIFIGPNSSGKSSTIHALASLAQTVSLPNNTRPLVLDDQYAYVHLGRFIEIIHSRKYTDTITLGLAGGEGRTHVRAGSSFQTLQGEPSAVYTFGSTKRTQDIFLKTAEVRLGPVSFHLQRQKSGAFAATKAGSPRSFRVRLGGGFSVDRASVIGRQAYMDLQPLFVAQRILEIELRKTLYLGPFREPPLRRYPTRGSAPREVGPRGEATVTLLANEMMLSKSRKNTKQVSTWFDSLGLAKNLGVSRVGNSDLFDVNITLKDGDKYPLADLGYGFSQILPVLTQLSFAPDRSTLLFEQPELHLHTLAVKPLAAVFIDAVKKKNLHIVAETHSRELFTQFLVEMRASNLDPNNFVAYRVVREGGYSNITKIEIDLSTFDVYEMWEKGLTTE